MVLGILKIDFRLRDWRNFMWQLLDILNIFNTFVRKKFLKNKKTVSKHWSINF